jgi:hypothetical protein
MVDYRELDEFGMDCMTEDGMPDAASDSGSSKIRAHST